MKTWAVVASVLVLVVLATAFLSWGPAARAFERGANEALSILPALVVIGLVYVVFRLRVHPKDDQKDNKP